MTDRRELRGRVVSGRGEAAGFTGLSWVREQFRAAMGADPFPGTLNVEVIAEERPLVEAFFAGEDFRLEPPDPNACGARMVRVSINGLPAAAVFPDKEYRVHGGETVELMAACGLKETLGIGDGDEAVMKRGRRLLSSGKKDGFPLARE